LTQFPVTRSNGQVGYQRLFLSLLLLGLIALPIVLVASTLDVSGRSSLVLAGILCLLAISFPLLLPGRVTALHEPLVPMTISVLIGCTMRSIYIAYSSSPRVPGLMMSQTYSDIAENSIWLILGLFCIASGYVITRARIPIENLRWIFDRDFNTGTRFNISMIIAVAVVLLATFLFIDAYGIDFALESISGKRTSSITTEDGEEVFSSLGHIRIMSEIGTSALYYFVAARLHRNKKFTPVALVTLITLFALSVTIPFLSSSRSEVGVVIINIVVLMLVFGKLQLRFLIVSIILVLSIIFGMAQLRAISQTGGYLENETFIDTVVGSANFVDIGRTSAILTRVPSNTGFLYGSSYLSLVTAPFPKVLWPEKPNPSLGPWVKSEIFGVWARNNGWPPNIVAEAYINFGYFGIIFVCFLFGSFIRLVYNSFSRLIPNNPAATLIYVSIYWSIGIKFIQLNFAQGMMISAQSAIAALIFVLFASVPNRKASLLR